MPSPRPAPLALALAACLVAAGCAGSESAVRPPSTVAPDSAAVAALRDSIAAAPSPAARRAVAVRALRAAGVTPLAGDLFETGVGAPLVGGFVPGRVPSRASELVVVAANLSEAAAADVLEAARVLVALSLVEVVPERTVRVALWPGTYSAREGVSLTLRSPLWPRPAVAAVVVVGGGAVPDVVGGVPVTRVPADAPDLAARVVRAVLERAAAPPIVPTPPAP
ncbi:hypothetical protein RQM47_13870 [Rubrivirga sp. S365]|uniref:Uncharacterized protein n=1 Tax=Rubrivirga litoralis TaxID=3075598 RepID=A0ABU3BMR1_9BACT|nr:MULTISPECIES: hypothetical protein [unclassified Rubrivirga]MDT0630553.1 hypothetical protein [Rubrivirga sp. F394]MDT7857735.1 hypothetical protein [Rubrivirga sp. S365]